MPQGTASSYQIGETLTNHRFSAYTVTEGAQPEGGSYTYEDHHKKAVAVYVGNTEKNIRDMKIEYKGSLARALDFFMGYMIQ